MECDLQARLSRIISPFNLTFETLVKALRISDFVLSGSGALAIIHADEWWSPGDLDFYGSIDGYASFHYFLVANGYSLKDNACQSYMIRSTSISAVHEYENKDRKINVVISATPVALQPIVQFHTTLVMNYVAWYGVVSLYSHPTLQRRGIINVDTPFTQHCFDKYQNRGFYIETATAWMALNNERYCTDNVRHIYDKDVSFSPFPGVSAALNAHVQQLLWQLNSVGCTLPHRRGFSCTANGFVVHADVEEQTQ